MLQQLPAVSRHREVLLCSQCQATRAADHTSLGFSPACRPLSWCSGREIITESMHLWILSHRRRCLSRCSVPHANVCAGVVRVPARRPCGVFSLRTGSGSRTPSLPHIQLQLSTSRRARSMPREPRRDLYSIAPGLLGALLLFVRFPPRRNMSARQKNILAYPAATNSRAQQHPPNQN